MEHTTMEHTTLEYRVTENRTKLIKLQDLETRNSSHPSNGIRTAAIYARIYHPLGWWTTRLRSLTFDSVEGSDRLVRLALELVLTAAEEAGEVEAAAAAEEEEEVEVLEVEAAADEEEAPEVDKTAADVVEAALEVDDDAVAEEEAALDT